MGFFLTVLYVLLIMVRPQEFIEEIRGWPIFDFLVAVCFLFTFIEGRITAERLRRSASSKLVFMFLIWCGLSHLGMFNFHLIVDSWVVFAKTAVVYYLITLNVDTLPRIKLFIWILIISITILSLQAIWLLYTGAAFGGAEALVRGEILQARGIGIFEDPNDLGLHIVTFVPFLLPMVHRPLLSRTMWTGLLLLVPVITGIAFTRSRGSLVGLAAVFGFYFYKRVGVFTSIIALVVVSAFLLSIPRMSSISTREGSGRTRMENWSEGMDMLKYRPVTGVGKGQFVEYHPETAHNSFVLVFAELGFVGAFFWVAMFFSAYRDIYFASRDPRAPPEIHRLCDGLLGALVGWHACAFFLSHSYKFLSFALVALAVGILSALDNMGIYVENSWHGRETKNAVLLTGGSIISFYILLRILWLL